MMVEDLTSFLQANSTVNAIIGNRVFPRILPEGSTTTNYLPAVVYNQVAAPHECTMDNARYVEETFQLECTADDYKTAKQLAVAVRNALEGFSGSMGGTNVHGIFIQAERDAPWDMETLHYRTDVDVKIWHPEN